MKENTNQAILYNALILSVRLVVTTLCGLLTTRFALQALGVTDFGLFALIGSIIAFMSIFNSIMLTTSNRFISVAIGKGDAQQANVQFNVNLAIQAGIAAATLLAGLPLGHWYIHHYVNFDGDIANAIMVFNLSIASAVVTFIGNPYNGLLMAKENFFVFSAADAVVHVAKTAVAFSLLYCFQDKLLVYAVSQSVLTVLPPIAFILYCRRRYPEYCRLRLVRDRQQYRATFSFSSWIAFGAFSMFGKNQASAMIVNAFFNTAMNAALGVANNVSLLITLICNNVAQPILPQINKSYAAGNLSRCNDLLVMSTKFTFLSILAVSSPVLVEPQWLFTLWLGKVPPYAVAFTLLLVADALVNALNFGISHIIFANGNIRLFQLSVSSLRLLSIVGAFLALSNGGPAESLFYAYIFFSVLAFFAGQWALHKTLHYDNSILIRRSYIPSLSVAGCFIPACLIPSSVHPLLHIIATLLYLLLLIFFLGLSRRERAYLSNAIRRKIGRA